MRPAGRGAPGQHPHRAAAVGDVERDGLHAVGSGGYEIGPRHLIPILPFLAVPVAWALQRASENRALTVGAGSLTLLSLPPATPGPVGRWDFPPEHVSRPLTQYSIPALLEGVVSLTTGMALGLNALASLLPLIPLVAVIAFAVPRGVGRLESVLRRTDRPVPRRDTDVSL